MNIAVLPGSAIADARTALAAAERLSGRDLTVLGGQEAAELIAELTTVVDMLSAARLAVLPTVQDSGVWALDGSQSAASWLARTDRSARAAAGSDFKVARALRDHLPLTQASIAAGTVPVAHARAIAKTCLRTEKLATMLSCPDRGEEFILDHAHLGLDDFRKFLNSWAYRVDPDAADAAYVEAKDGFTFALATTLGGTVPSGCLDPMVGEGLLVMLRAEIGVPSKDDKRTTAQRMHDALGSVVNRVLGGGELGHHASVRPSVVVHVPYATLEAKVGTAGLAPAVLQESGQGISRALLDQMMCDCSITRVIFGPRGELLDVGRAQRTFTGPRRRALDAHDGGCMFPGCFRPPSQCVGHHRNGWANGALTDAKDEGILYCFFHHPYVHEHQISVERDAVGDWVHRDRHGNWIGTSRPRSLLPDFYAPDPWDLPAA